MYLQISIKICTYKLVSKYVLTEKINLKWINRSFYVLTKVADIILKYMVGICAYKLVSK